MLVEEKTQRVSNIENRYAAESKFVVHDHRKDK
jgi:hypothetical protein